MNNKQPKISIIVPVYNGERYIERCLNSILSQTLSGIEAILSNDGSDDGSLLILKAYSQKFPDIFTVDDHENIGVANTRNRAIASSKGTYIMLLDQDDFIDPDYCETFYKAIEESGADVVIGGFRRQDESGKITQERHASDKGHAQYLFMVSWAKIHRADFVKRNGIVFFDNNNGEDVIFSIKEARCTDRFETIHYIGYNWFDNSDSVSNTSHKGFNREIDTLSLIREIQKLNETDDKIIEYLAVKNALYYLLYSGRTGTSKRFMAVYDDIFKLLAEICPNYRHNKYLFRTLKGERASSKLKIIIFMTIHKLRLVWLFARIYCKGTA